MTVRPIGTGVGVGRGSGGGGSEEEKEDINQRTLEGPLGTRDGITSDNYRGINLRLHFHQSTPDGVGNRYVDTYS